MAEPSTTSPVLLYEDAVRLAMLLHQRGQLDAAERAYRSLCEARPGDPNPLHFLGVLLHQRGNDRALDLIQRSIALDPNVASWHNNLGNVLLDRGQLDAASAAYVRCTELEPENFEVLNNLGVLLTKLKRYDQAEEVLKRSLSKEANFASAHTNLAKLYYEQRRIAEGHEHIAAVLALRPADPNARKYLGLLYAALGRLDEAAVIFQQWLDHEPGSEQAKHHLAACSGGAAPERATERYVEEVFDSFAGSFDAKLAALEYRAPTLVGDAVQRLLGEPVPRFRILDLGCGTGLCGSFLQGYAQSLVGIDLSANMLERARSRGCYSALIKSDLGVYLQNCEATYDVLVSADTLCYFGRLDEIIKAARRVMGEGAYFVFTVEALKDGVLYRLNPSGRYSHSEAYIRRMLHNADFQVVSLANDSLRTETGKPVEGLVVAAQAVGANSDKK